YVPSIHLSIPAPRSWARIPPRRGFLIFFLTASIANGRAFLLLALVFEYISVRARGSRSFADSRKSVRQGQGILPYSFGMPLSLLRIGTVLRHYQDLFIAPSGFSFGLFREHIKSPNGQAFLKQGNPLSDGLTLAE
ncbi:hypothetical protein CP532_4376, partial [Ophiocordyceps camponoti-leonardi (nom. inval.)]